MFKWLKSLFANPKTTILGITTLASTGAGIAAMVKGTVPVTPESISAAGTGIATGLGLIVAGDSTTTSTDGE